jgi:hypothetical protein
MRHPTMKTLPILAFALSTGLAFATEPTPPLDPVQQPIPTDTAKPDEAKPSFESLDTNRDGQIAKAEVPVENELTTLFAHFDHNKDLYLSRSEFDEYAEEDEEEAE